MVSEIISILSNDTTLRALIGSTITDTRIYPLKTMNNYDCIVYKNFPVSDNGVKVQERMEINIIASTYKKALDIAERVNELLLTIGDTPLTSTVLEVELNGGGINYKLETDKVHRTLFLDILYRR